MPTTVTDSARFKKDLRRLARKYAKALDEVEALSTALKNDQRPGEVIPNVGYEVYKVRLANPSAGRGKSGRQRDLTDYVF